MGGVMGGGGGDDAGNNVSDRVEAGAVVVVV